MDPSDNSSDSCRTHVETHRGGVSHQMDLETEVIFIKIDGELSDQHVDWWSGAILADPRVSPTPRSKHPLYVVA